MKENDIEDKSFFLKDLFILFWLEREGLLDTFLSNHENCKAREKFYFPPGDTIETGKIRAGQDILRYVPSGFSWHGSPEGMEYWVRVWERCHLEWKDGIRDDETKFEMTVDESPPPPFSTELERRMPGKFEGDE